VWCSEAPPGQAAVFATAAHTAEAELTAERGSQQYVNMLSGRGKAIYMRRLFSRGHCCHYVAARLFAGLPC